MNEGAMERARRVVGRYSGDATRVWDLHGSPHGIIYMRSGGMVKKPEVFR
jgi:hypothetical protein